MVAVSVVVADIGSVAHDVLIEAVTPGAEAEVVAVYERSCYVRTPGGLACVGSEEIGAGPLNMRVRLADGQSWPGLGLRPEMPVTRVAGRLAIGPDLLIHVGDTKLWSPPPLPVWSAATLRAGLAAVHGAAEGLCPHDGLARLVLSPQRTKPSNPHATAARVPFEIVVRELGLAMTSGAASPDLIGSATLLLGLGPGLTPSGDDLLGGAMIALTSTGQAIVRDQLWDALRPELDMLTTEISAMHLAVAADGLGSDVCHRALNAILSGALPDLDAIDAIGHTSGWDTLAGMIVALDAWAGMQ
jgi:hypothetical protein